MPDSLAKILVVMISGDGKNRPTSVQKGSERLLEMTDRVSKAIRSCQFAEQVSRDQQDIGSMLFADARNFLDPVAQVLSAVDSTEPVSQVPIRGMNDAHYCYSATPGRSSASPDERLDKTLALRNFGIPVAPKRGARRDAAIDYLVVTAV
jgi:hypothetical protein